MTVVNIRFIINVDYEYVLLHAKQVIIAFSKKGCSKLKSYVVAIFITFVVPSMFAAWRKQGMCEKLLKNPIYLYVTTKRK